MDYSGILKKISPSAGEEKKVLLFANKALETAKKRSGLDAVICGSLGKGTWLSGNHDIDIFILFPKETPREMLEKKGLGIGAAVCKDLAGRSCVRYAEHPYTMCMAGGFKIDIVPCYRIRPGESIISAVDRSPLHLEYVKANLKEEMKGEVRLLKQFCKSAGMYGSDAKTQGFSGYICELLVLKYGTFHNAISAASKWRLPYTVDVAGHASGHREIFVVIDPTDAGRNAAAVVSPCNAMKFIKAAGRFIASPSADCFVEQKPKPMSAAQVRQLKARGTHFICLSMKRPDIMDDTLYPQARRAVSRLGGILRHNEFVPIRSYEYLEENEVSSGSRRTKFSADLEENEGKEMFFFFELEVGNLPGVKKMTGPPLFAGKHVEEFMKKYGSLAYVEGINICADRRRDYRTPRELFEAVMKNSEKELAAMGIPEAVAKPLRSAKLLEQEAVFRLLKSCEGIKDSSKISKNFVLCRNGNFSGFLRRMYFDGSVS